jgi:hypothetical protein
MFSGAALSLGERCPLFVNAAVESIDHTDRGMADGCSVCSREHTQRTARHLVPNTHLHQ